LATGAEYVTDACADAEIIEEFCGTDLALEPTDEPNLVEGMPFAISASVSCDIDTLERHRARAARILMYDERRLVDAQFEAAALATTTSIGANQTSIVKAVGAAEHFLAGSYGGLGVILAPVHAVTAMCAANIVCRNELDGRLYTCQGTPVAGLAVGAAVNAGVIPIYATGRITLLRGPVNMYDAPSSFDGTEWLPPRAIAQRIYVPLVECVAGEIGWDDTP
jgi:hypothetical protein